MTDPGDVPASPRKPGETEAEYFDRMADAFRPPDRSIEIVMKWHDGPRDLNLVRIVVRPDGTVDARRLRGKRLIFKLKPPPGDEENRFALLERAAAACRAYDEF